MVRYNNAVATATATTAATANSIMVFVIAVAAFMAVNVVDVFGAISLNLYNEHN